MTINSSVRSEVLIEFPVSAGQQHVKGFLIDLFSVMAIFFFVQGALGLFGDWSKFQNFWPALISGEAIVFNSTKAMVGLFFPQRNASGIWKNGGMTQKDYVLFQPSLYGVAFVQFITSVSV
jgi:hypothetical protein